MDERSAEFAREAYAAYLPSAECARLLQAQRLVTDVVPRDSRALVECTMAAVGLLARHQVHAEYLLALLLFPLYELDLSLSLDLSTTFGLRASELARQLSELARNQRLERPLGSASEALYAERLRRLFAAAYRAPEVVVLYLALERARVTEPQPEKYAEQRLWAEEMEAIFLPLCEMLGMRTWRREIGDLCVAILNPKKREALSAYLHAYAERHTPAFAEIKGFLEREWKDRGLAADMSLHLSRPSSLRRRESVAAKKGQEFSLAEIIQLMRVDIAMSSEEACYTTLGLLHRRWRPIRGAPESGMRFLDYLADPKFNGYRCLVTTVEVSEPGSARRRVEFRICTRESQRVNEQGFLAARMSSAPAFSVKGAWWDDDNLRALLGALTFDQRGRVVHVFSPIGQLFELPGNSTPVDYAFRIHTGLAARARHFEVNGRFVDHDYRLCDGDLVNVDFDPHARPAFAEWRQSVQTGTAKKGLASLAGQSLTLYDKGERQLNDALKRELDICGLLVSDEKRLESISKVARRQNCKSIPSLYAAVANRELFVDNVAWDVLEDQLLDSIVLADGRPWPREAMRIARCWPSLPSEKRDSKESRVVPGCEIIGNLVERKGRHPLLVVHRADCTHVLSLCKERVLSLAWRAPSSQREAALFRIRARDHPKILQRVLEPIYALYDQDIYLHSLHANVGTDGFAPIEVTVSAPTSAQLSLLQDKFEALQREVSAIQGVDVWGILPDQKMRLYGKEPLSYQNPYTLGDIRRPDMFFGREKETARIVECIRGEQKLIVLYGHKRTGKTSLLNHLCEQFPGGKSEFVPILLDVQSCDLSASALLFKLSETIREAVGRVPRGGRATKLAALHPKDLQQDAFWSFYRWLEQAERMLTESRLFIMIDEFNLLDVACREGKLDRSFFDGLRWLILSKLNARFLLALQEVAYNGMSSGRDARGGLLLSGQPIRLGYLDTDAAARLIRQPLGQLLEYEQPVIERLLTLSGCNPYYLHVLCRSIVARMADLGRRQVGIEDLHQIVAELLRLGMHYFDHFLDDAHGPAAETLAAIASASAEGGWVTEEQVLQAAYTLGYSMRAPLFMKSCERLVSGGLVEKDPESSRYRIPIDLFRLWLVRYKPLEHVR